MFTLILESLSMDNVQVSVKSLVTLQEADAFSIYSKRKNSFVIFQLCS